MDLKRFRTFEASGLGLGCMGMTGFYGDVNKQQCIQAIQTALENDVTFLDTADNYGVGDNESLIGAAIALSRKKVCIATKVGVVRKKENPHIVSINGTPQYIKQQCVNSLKRLRVPVIDLYYLHHVDPNTPIEETIHAMSELVSEGLVRHLGLAVHPITAVQAEYSLFSREAEKQILPLCKELGIGFVACSPICRGLLSGTITSFQGLTPGDFRKHFPRFQTENLVHNLSIVSALKKVANEKSCSLSQLSLAWVVARAPSIIPLFGTTQSIHVLENIKSKQIHLTEQDIDKINEIVSRGMVRGDRHPEMVKQLYDPS
ncbi:MAG: aldo/keto reductase [Chlamydiales bacterium]|nr:aldo/keto reductase [Chlamydiales bacterium]